MVDFSHIEKQTALRNVIDFVMHEVPGEPVLYVTQASNSNRPFINALIKRQEAYRRGFRRREKLTADTISRDRLDDLQLYPKHVITGWKNVTDADGQEVSFCEEDCRDFLRAIPTWLFDDLRNFCQDPINFTEFDESDKEDAGKN